jgi:putative membrane protein
MGWLVGLLVSTVGVWFVAYILPGVEVKNLGTAFWVALLLSLINGTVGWLLKILTFPITLLTLGLFSFLINVFIILLVDKLVPGFHIKNFWNAVLFAILLSIITSIVHWII